MASYKPPFARMRQIKQNAPPRPALPQNVEEALEAVAAAQAAGEDVPDEIRVPVGTSEVVITPGPDKTFGTADDVVQVEPVVDAEALVADLPAGEDEAEVEEVEAVVEDEDEEAPKVAKPSYDMTDKKADLLAIAEAHGAAANDTMTKKQIIDVLDAHFE